MKQNSGRRDFIRKSLIAGAGLGIANNVTPLYGNSGVESGKKVGLIGLDTSHVTAIANALNKSGENWDGYRVVAAYPTSGSGDMPASIDRLQGFTEQVRNMGVEIVNSIDELLEKTDVVMLESVDGRRHLAEALPVLKAGKRMFIDKPFASSLAEGITIVEASKKFNTPIFHSSSVRYMEGIDEIREGKIGKVIGADSYGDCYIEPNHQDLFYYCIHGIELLYEIMGVGCKSVVRVHLEGTDMVVGTWQDERIGSYRGNRLGTRKSGVTVFGEKGMEVLNQGQGYNGLWTKVIDFFNTGMPHVSPEETLEVLAFMEAGEESKRKGGIPVSIESVMEEARVKSRNYKY